MMKHTNSKLITLVLLFFFFFVMMMIMIHLPHALQETYIKSNRSTSTRLDAKADFAVVSAITLRVRLIKIKDKALNAQRDYGYHKESYIDLKRKSEDEDYGLMVIRTNYLFLTRKLRSFKARDSETRSRQGLVSRDLTKEIDKLMRSDYPKRVKGRKRSPIHN